MPECILNSEIAESERETSDDSCETQSRKDDDSENENVGPYLYEPDAPAKDCSASVGRNIGLPRLSMLQVDRLSEDSTIRY